MDGRESPEYDAVAAPQFSLDSKVNAYLASKGGKWFVVVNGVPAKTRFEAFLKGSSIMIDKDYNIHIIGIHLPDKAKFGPNFVKYSIDTAK
jgi:hypothetical protein